MYYDFDQLIFYPSKNIIHVSWRGVRYKPIGASALLRRNLFIYGLGGVLVPFVGIKLIDLLISVFF